MNLGASTRLRHLLSTVGAFRPFLRDVPISILRHDSKHVHLQEGYGGAPIELFPPYRFFALDVAGKTAQARADFAEWYKLQFDRYQDVSKGKGGLHTGSLYREVLGHHARAGVALDPMRPQFRDELVRLAVAERVDQRFGLLRSIRESGYRPERSDPVIGIACDDGTIRLEGGAHRAAALRALDKHVLPSVLVLSDRARHWLRRLKVIR